MENKTLTHTALVALLYFVTFLGLQIVIDVVAMLLPQLPFGLTPTVLATTVSSLLTIALFLALRWARVSPNYLRTRPWDVFLWAAVLALGTIIPSEWLIELIGADLPEEAKKLFMQLIQSPMGYFIIALLVPFTEEIVFRGAILRAALNSPMKNWLAVVLSALLFAVAHGNMAQMPHAFLLGLLLGWMYERTRSILPGLVVHLVNNSVAFLLLRLTPDNPDAQLIDLLQGNRMMELLYVGFSLLVILPSLYQLHLRMKR